MKFQAMYSQSDPERVKGLCQRARMALLLTVDPQGRPRSGWTNAGGLGPGFMVHLASDDPQAADLRGDSRATLVFAEILSTIPSYWVDPRDASRATNLYLHAEFDCEVRLLDGADSVEALDRLMKTFQPEGGHAPLHDLEGPYPAKIQALCVALFEVKSQRTKWKLGQVWPPALRLDIVQKLRERGRPEDLRSVAEMESWFAAHP